MQNNYYTLEKHLDEVCEIDEDYKILQSIWLLNKQNISKGLSIVPNSFPGYSSHDASHSMNIINNIQNFLGEARIKELGVTDTFLILMSCLTHDIGMILSYKLIEEEWSKESFISQLDWFGEHGDKQLSDAVLMLKKLKARKSDFNNNFSWALEVKNAVILLTSEIFRGKHARISSDYLSHHNDFWKLANNFYSEQIPSRFMDLLSKVAYLHGESFDNIFKMLQFKANGYKGDYIHPRFIACLIRLGDLLDFDNNRFNEFSISTLKELPETSQLHKEKHAAVRHMLVSPDSIEADLDCDSEEVYRVARCWFDMLEYEVSLQSREWTNIAPKDLTGLPPIISKNSIKIYFQGEEANSEMLNLKFTISTKKMFNILQGGAIYQEPGFAFIREVVQNALDASKLQLWKDISDGIYDLLLNGKSIDDIKYPDDIPDNIYQQYPIRLNIKWTDDNKSSITVICEDKGVGISKSVLLRMTNHVGESHKKDKGYEDVLKSTPFWLKPTAAFGIGLQSVFFVNKKFIVDTKALGEKSMKIIFRSAADDNYCSVLKGSQTKRGTRVEVVIEKDRFSELFGNSFSWDILDRVDVFSSQGNDKYLAKIEEYIRKKIGLVENFNFTYTIDGCQNLNIINNDSEEDSQITYVNYDNFKIGYIRDEDTVVFKIIENEHGSIMHLYFYDNIDFQSRYHNKLLLRSVEISSAQLSYYLTSYLGIQWDLYNESSDRIVDLSRDKLLPQGSSWVAETLLRGLLPKFIKAIVELFNNTILKNETKSDQLLYQYFFAIITAKMFENSINCDIPDLDKIKMQTATITNNKHELITCKEFIDSNIIYLVDIHDAYLKLNNNNISDIKTDIDYQFCDDSNIIWSTANNRNDFYNYLKFNYKCIEICTYNEKYHIIKLTPITKSDSSYKKYVKFDDYKYYLSLQSGRHIAWGSRSTIYPIEKYKCIVVKNVYIGGFETFPNYTDCSIFMPFGKNNTFKKLFEEIKGKAATQREEHIKANITEYISQPLITAILKNSVVPDETNQKLIISTYIQLIKDIIDAELVRELLLSGKTFDY